MHFAIDKCQSLALQYAHIAQATNQVAALRIFLQGIKILKSKDIMLLCSAVEWCGPNTQ